MDAPQDQEGRMNTNELRAAFSEALNKYVRVERQFTPTGLYNEAKSRQRQEARAAVETLFADAVKDAERYRWLRDHADTKFSGGLTGLKLAHTTLGAKSHVAEWDKRIDSARAAVSPEVTK